MHHILILYTSKSGTTATCARMLAEHFAGQSVTVRDLAESAPALIDYDIALLGAPVRMGHLEKKMKAYLADNESMLHSLTFGFFVCCADDSQTEEYLRAALPVSLREHATALACFGGELKVDHQKNFFMKLVVRAMRSYALEDTGNPDEEHRPLPEILPEHIRQFADTVRRTF